MSEEKQAQQARAAGIRWAAERAWDRFVEGNEDIEAVIEAIATQEDVSIEDLRAAIDARP